MFHQATPPAPVTDAQTPTTTTTTAPATAEAGEEASKPTTTADLLKAQADTLANVSRRRCLVCLSLGEDWIIGFFVCLVECAGGLMSITGPSFLSFWAGQAPRGGRGGRQAPDSRRRPLWALHRPADRCVRVTDRRDPPIGARALPNHLHRADFNDLTALPPPYHHRVSGGLIDGCTPSTGLELKYLVESA